MLTARKEVTAFLSDLLVDTRLSGIGKYYASEVSLDYGSKEVRRIDFLQFEPANTMSVSGIEKGIFTCYEIKSCKEDFNSGYGLNFVGEKNYLVMTMETYKAVLPDLPKKGCGSIGVMVAVPQHRTAVEEFECPTAITDMYRWKLEIVYPCRMKQRDRSMTELLFCMLRSGQ